MIFYKSMIWKIVKNRFRVFELFRMVNSGVKRPFFWKSIFEATPYQESIEVVNGLKFT